MSCHELNNELYNYSYSVVVLDSMPETLAYNIQGNRTLH